MSNTGQKIYQWLIQIDQTTGLPTGLRKPNDPADPDYISPITDYTSCPLPVAPTFSWVPDTSTCEQANLFGLVAQYTGFSSPFGILWDNPTGRFYCVDNDDTLGNFYYYNPDTITGFASVTHIGGSTYTDINSYLVDKVNRRIIAVGDASDGARVLDIATNTITTLPYGTNTTAGSGRRAPLAMSDTAIYCFCSLPNILRRYNRSTLAFIDEINKSTIPSFGTYLVNGYSINFVGSEIWVGATSRANSSIARYSSDFMTLIGTITLPGVIIPSGTWSAASRYWQGHYFDSTNNRYYVADIGSRKIFVINASTQTIINSYIIGNTRGKNFIDAGFSLNELDGKIYMNVRCTNDLTDSTSNFKLYRLNATTGAIEYVYPDASVTQLTSRAGTIEQWGVAAGQVSWSGGSTWSTDGIISKYQ